MRTETFGEGDGLITLHLGDMREIIPERVAPGSVDAVITDPPYGCTACKWDSRPADMDDFWRVVRPTARKAAAFCICAMMPFAADVVQSNRKMFRYDWVWERSNLGNVFNANKMPLRAHESVLVFYDSLPSYNQQFTKGRPYTAGKFPFEHLHGKHIDRKDNPEGILHQRTLLKRDAVIDRTIAGYMGGKAKCDNRHPTRKPLPLMEYMIRTYTNPGELVLDPYFGSGTTAAACVRTGRRFTGCEMVEEYFDRACRRIERELAERAASLPGICQEQAKAANVAGGLLGA